MSRRKAFIKFLAGAGVVGFLSGGRVEAGTAVPPSECPSHCLGVAELNYETCLEGCGGNPEVCFFELMSSYQCCLSECKHEKVPKSCKVP